MEDVKCPKCKEDLQFPFMICPDCKWKPKGKDIDQHNYLARRYISERPYEEQDQLKMVLDSVMVKKNEEKQVGLDRKAIRKETNERIKVHHIILSFLVGSLWILCFGIFIAIGEPVPIFNLYCLVGLIVSFFCSIAAPILLILKLVSLRK